MGADPAMGEYLPVAPTSDDARKHNQQLPGMGGVFDYGNLAVYHYASNNPVRYVDPDGRSDGPGYDDVSVYYQNLYDSSLEQANDAMSVGIRHYIEQDRPLALSDLSFLMPIDGSPRRTSDYGFQSLEIGGETVDRWHGGWDFAAMFGTPVRAAHSGFVRIDPTLDAAFGDSVFIDLAKLFPYDKHVPFFRVTTQYSHLSSYVVSDGHFVDRGQVIGYVGDTGWSTGYHLDFRIFLNGRLADPAMFYR